MADEEVTGEPDAVVFPRLTALPLDADPAAVSSLLTMRIMRL